MENVRPLTVANSRCMAQEGRPSPFGGKFFNYARIGDGVGVSKVICVTITAVYGQEFVCVSLAAVV